MKDFPLAIENSYPTGTVWTFWEEEPMKCWWILVQTINKNQSLSWVLDPEEWITVWYWPQGAHFNAASTSCEIVQGIVLHALVYLNTKGDNIKFLTTYPFLFSTVYIKNKFLFQNRNFFCKTFSKYEKHGNATKLIF